jgi:hypothetical protein
MASKNFPRKIKIDKYRKIVENNCFHFYEPVKHLDEINEMKQYCLVNFGEPRGNHPLNEVIHGWMLNIEGDWAATWFSKYGAYVFWFKRTEDKILFNLTFWNQ